MDFTREPIIESIITPRDGCKLVVRSSKASSQEEFFVDAVEIVSFGHNLFFRSLEKPKSFLVPCSDYELLEVREARMVLKNIGLDRSIKISGNKEPPYKNFKETAKSETVTSSPPAEETAASSEEQKGDSRMDKKRGRRHYRRRRGRDDSAAGREGSWSKIPVETDTDVIPSLEDEGPIELIPPDVEEEELKIPVTPSNSILTSLLPPPPTLISETIARYKDNDMFRGVFYDKEEEDKSDEREEKEDSEEEKEGIAEEERGGIAEEEEPAPGESLEQAPSVNEQQAQEGIEKKSAPLQFSEPSFFSTDSLAEELSIEPFIKQEFSPSTPADEDNDDDDTDAVTNHPELQNGKE